MILETVSIRSRQVATLVLAHLDLPAPRGPGAPRVNINVNVGTQIRGWHPHVLTSVVAADDWRGRETRSSN